MPRNKELRLIIDTNLWISFLISNRQDRLDSLLNITGVKFLFSKELLDEINTTIAKPKLKKYLSVHALSEMLNDVGNYIEMIKVSSKIDICRDIKDNFLLELAKDGNADFLLTGDKDLLELKKTGKTKIITFANFSDDVINKNS